MKVKSRMSADLRRGYADDAAAREQPEREAPKANAKQQRQAQIGERRHRIDLETAKVPRLDRIRCRSQLVGADRRDDAGAEHQQGELADQGRIDPFERRQNNDVTEYLEAGQ